ncbi:MAG: sigma-70 family RNA polymerase sigma factor [Solirubrobacterales bacterium]|nr:sigma-70 family RNA polymerase sigma factor [Solirubrobacterales bacterium]MBV9799772.1 sigma-70 family RNA polymerase sigma factor [Solirubrobacterales bacterium]
MYLVQDGDISAFEVIFDRHVDAAYSLAHRICGRRAMAEDAVQEAFLSLWRANSRYDPARGSVRAWVASVVHNRALDAVRVERAKAGRDVRDELAAERVAGTERTESEVQRRDERREILRALDALPTDQRQVIELAYFGGLTHSEIARKLSLPAGTVKGRMRLGLGRMRALLGDSRAVVL